MQVTTWLALTNLVALVPIYQSWVRFGNNSTSTVILGNMALASFLMHLTETKHGLRPDTVLITFSSIFLNIDRVMAIVTSVYFGSYWWQEGRRLLPLYLTLFGLLCNFIGEQTYDLTLYTVSHTVWHLCAYGSLTYLLIN